MKEQLESQGYDNVEVIPNCKELDILDANTIKYTEGIPYRLCTFSRVIKEKGIEDAVQAVCDYRKLNAYFFFTCGDLLDAPKWDEQMKKDQVKHTQHDAGHFDIALELAYYITE